MKDIKSAEKLFFDSLEAYNNNNFKLSKKKLLEANEITPNRESILVNLMNSCFMLSEYTEALMYANKVKKIYPDNKESIFVVIEIHLKQNNLEHANLELNNLDQNTEEFLVFSSKIAKKIGDFEKYFFFLEKIFNKNAKDKSFLKSLIFNLMYFCPFDQIKFNNYINLYKKLQSIEKYKNYKLSKKKIILGFVTQGFDKDPVIFFLKDIFKHLKDYAELICYSNSEQEKIFFDLENYFSKWVNTKNLTSEELANQIYEDNVTVLFDLSGYTGDHKLEVFFLKPAPIQISWCGMLASTQIEQIDYIIIDKFIDQFSLKENFSEEKLFIDNIFCTFSSSSFEGVNLNYKRKHISTFNYGSWSNPFKINDSVLYAWSEILKKTKNSILFLNYINFINEKCQKFFFKKFSNLGIDENRLVFNYYKRNDAISRYNEIDLCLDTFPYSGGTTNFEASFMNKPILTLKGSRFVSNSGLSINMNLDNQFLICDDINEYINKAIKISEDKSLLEKLINNIKLNKSRLFDSKKFSENLYLKLKTIVELKIN